MKEKRECKLVQDLLPNYIEKVTRRNESIYGRTFAGVCRM